MSNRVSNEQILTALTDLPGAIAKAMAGNVAASPKENEVKGSGDDPETVNVDGAYLSHVTSKLQSRANSDGNTYVLYARKNVAGQTKLAYCLGSKWTALTDKRIIGAVKTVAPE